MLTKSDFGMSHSEIFETFFSLVSLHINASGRVFVRGHKLHLMA